jgi:Zn-dependent protease with chaperone function
MNRRNLLAAGCAWCVSTGARAQGLPDYSVPDRYTKPDLSSDEGGLWAIMDREERNLRRSPFALRDAELKGYLEDLACKLGGKHCPDIRVHVVRTGMFNASMAPNGMMVIWTGLLLRIENEAQLAAVMSHEIAHYLQRHSIERLRDIKSKAAFGQFLGALGLVGALAQLAVLAGAFAFSREQETEADRIGAFLMHQAGYDVAESPRIWGNLVEEARAREGKDTEKNSPMFATHPTPPERQRTLEQIAAAVPGGVVNSEGYAKITRRFLPDWLEDEMRRGQYEETVTFLTRNLNRSNAPSLMLYQRGEVYRIRNAKGDSDLAIADYQAAVGRGDEPVQTHRGLGLLARQQGNKELARKELQRYLDLAPDAPDASLIKSYLPELNS